MIPVQLKLKNFMSYGEMPEPIDFSQIHVACLTGANGNGKSTLLEAMTWAMWGKARASSNDDLIRFGARDMQVEFVFDLGHERYRILRSRSIHSRGGRSSLEFQIFNEKQGKFVSLTQKNMRNTQEQINKVLRMDYDTFVNSAFILQNKADSFTVKNPTERKQILSDILNLEIYDVLESRARRKRRDADQASHTLNASLKELDEELSHKAKYENENKRLKSSLGRLQRNLQTKETQLEALRQQQTELKTKRDQVNEYDERLNQTRREIDDLNQKIQETKQKLAGYEAILKNEKDILDKFSQLEAAKTEESAWVEKQEAYQRLKEERAELDQAIQAAQHKLELEVEQIKATMENLEKRAQEDQKILKEKKEIEAGIQKLAKAKRKNHTLLNRQRKQAELMEELHHLEKVIADKRHVVELEKKSIEDKIAGLKQRLAASGNLEKEYAAAKKELAALETKEKERQRLKELGITKKAEIEAFTTRNQTIDKLIKEIHEKMDLMDHAGAQCPLCSAKLDESGREHIIQKIQQEHQELMDEKRQNERAIAAIENELKAFRKTYKILEQELGETETIRKRVTEIALLMEQHQQIKQELPSLEHKLAELNDQLEQHTYATAEKEELRKLQSRIKRNKYDKEEHERIREKIDQLARWNHKKGQLDAAISEVNQIEKELPKHQKKLELRLKKLKENAFAITLRRKRERVQKKIDQLDYDPEAHVAVRRRIRELASYERKKIELEHAQQAIDEVRKNLNDMKSQLGRKESQLAKIREQRDSLFNDIRDLPKIEENVRTLDTELITIRRDEAVTRTSLGRNEERLEHLRQLEQQRKTKQQELKEQQELKGIYNDLVYAFSKKGIQALIIERILPELEEEANEILQRLSDHRMYVKFESQKTQKSGNIAETLEIRVTDESSTRPYELFSGGEAFRINFAIRIALSKLLARRAGAKLQTLVVDEGFGTQDAEGRDRLVEVISTIADDFEKILVITHIPELNDAFPTRISVTKDETTGSHAVVI
ncbi:MAG: hypothetical protein D6675_03590 [Gemmatimonadetes bacterium]|nr:MAG: hypothetical protein D6675_03590 [Gemmatimonadota bacterium]